MSRNLLFDIMFATHKFHVGTVPLENGYQGYHAHFVQEPSFRLPQDDSNETMAVSFALIHEH